MEADNPRLCVMCRHIYWDSGSPGYSELTPGEDMALHCTKGYWNLRNEDDLRKCMLNAQTCKDFEDYRGKK